MKVIIDSDDWGWDRKDPDPQKRIESETDLANLFQVLNKHKAVMTTYMVMKDFKLTDTWRQGIEAGVVNPQLHGYCHNNRYLTYGAVLYRKAFNKRAEVFTAPCYKWSRENERWLSRYGIKQISTVRIANRRLFYTGKTNKYGQKYIVRNAFLEGIHTPDMCMDQIRWAFFWNRPAIICTHRINYVNSRNLDNLDTLLGWVKKEWPETKFIPAHEI